MTDDGPTAAERFLGGILPENPVYRQLLGMCPTLAVTGGMKPAMTMAAATAFVLISANIMVSLIRGLLSDIPGRHATRFLDGLCFGAYGAMDRNRGVNHG